MTEVDDPTVGVGWVPDPNRISELFDWLDESATLGPSGKPDLIWSWRHMSRQRALQAWLDLADWVEWWRFRYNVSAITGCWYRHSPVVEHLWALMIAHRNAYPPGTKPDEFRDAPITWHVSYMWPTVRALREGNYMQGCTPGNCRATEMYPVPLYEHRGEGGLEEFLVAEIAGREDRPVEKESDQPTMSVDDMRRAVRTGMATPVDAENPDASLYYENAIWHFDEAADLYRREPDPED